MSWPRFITFEGGEGAGKSTQIKLLAQRLRGIGTDVICTREPGGTTDADTIRELLVTGQPDRWSAEAEILLNYAARDNHLSQLIRPSLEAGKTVLCDRFSDSTRVYQGIAGGADADFIEQLDKLIVGSTVPDLTFVLDLDPAYGLARARERGGGDRFERKGPEYHNKLRAGFREIAGREPDRCVIIDGSASEDKVADDIWSVLQKRTKA